MQYIVFILILVFPIYGSTDCLTDIIKELMSDKPNHKLYKNEGDRVELRNDIVEGTGVYSADPVLAIYVAFRESGFNCKEEGDFKNGKARSKGMLQFGYVVRSVCRKELNLNLQNRKDQVVCFAYWIKRLESEEECGTLEGALRAYASKGGTCKGTPKGRRIARQRIKKVKELRKQCRKQNQ